ncbi:MAG: hypothetical protein WCI51_04255 [Lentisphaerota bacterium]
MLENKDLKIICNGNVLYVHCPQGLTSSTLSLAPLTDEPGSVVLMNNGQPIDWTFQPLVYQRHCEKNILRVRNIPVDELIGPAVIKLSFGTEKLFN